MKMKFKAHQSFFIRKGWLSKGLKALQDNKSIFMPSGSKAAMDELGLGSNQVVALRYWLQATGLIETGYRNREHRITELGDLILEKDPYMEEMGTLWALHCNIASSQELAASWYFFFNVFGVKTFDKEEFTRSIERYIYINNDKSKVAINSLDSDFSCILNTYIPHDRTGSKVVSPESVIDCPLGELGLVDIDNPGLKTYRKKPAILNLLPDQLVLYAMCPTRAEAEAGTNVLDKEIRLETLVDGARMPGRVFNLDSVAVLTKLYELESKKILRINRTAGLDVVRLSDTTLCKEDCLSRYYDLIG